MFYLKCISLEYFNIKDKLVMSQQCILINISVNITTLGESDYPVFCSNLPFIHSFIHSRSTTATPPATTIAPFATLPSSLT